MRCGRLVFPRLTSHHLPVTLSKGLRYRNAQPTNSVWPENCYEVAHVGVG